MRYSGTWIGPLVLLSMLLAIACQPTEQMEGEEGEEAMEEGAMEEGAMEEAVSDEAAAEAAIQRLVDDFTVAWSQGDAQAIAALFAGDGDMVAPDGEMLQGAAAIEARYAELFQGMYKGTEINIQPTSMRFLEPDVVVADGSYQITGARDAEGQELPATRGLYTNILIKDAGQWRILSNRPMIPVETGGTT